MTQKPTAFLIVKGIFIKMLKEEKGSLSTFTALGFTSVIICVFIAITLVVCSVMIKAHTVNGWLHTSMKHAMQAAQVTVWCPIEERVVATHIHPKRACDAFENVFTEMTNPYISGQLEIEPLELKETSSYIKKPGFAVEVKVPIWSGYLPFVGYQEFNIPMSYFVVIGEY